MRRRTEIATPDYEGQESIHGLFDGKWQEQKSSTLPSLSCFFKGICMVLIFFFGYASSPCKSLITNDANQTIKCADRQTTNNTTHKLKIMEMGGPDHFCSSTSYNVRRTKFRDIICSNYVDNANALNRNNIDVPPTLLPPTMRKIVFLHFPKTGGESLEEALDLFKSHETWWNRQGPVLHEDNLIITIVRNPYDRMLSWFRFCLHGYEGNLPTPTEHCILAHQLIIRHQKYYRIDEITSLNKTHVSAAFERWLTNIVLNQQLYHPWVNLPFLEFIGGASPLFMDYIIRFEHYEQDFNLLAKALGRNATVKMINASNSTSDGALRQNDDDERVGVTPKPHIVNLLNTDYREIYTDKAREMIEMRFAKDLLYFNYTF